MLWIKGAVDRTAAMILLLLLSPLIAATALSVLAFLGRPLFFRQPRPGLHMRPFTILKFRTMKPDSNAVGSAGDEARLTRFGRLLRSISLDELPELLNVLRGEMSIVGPRPLLMQYIPRYTPEQARRHEMVPGITGLAQVSGRNAIDWEQRFRIDVWYVDNWSLLLDVKILARTLLKVLVREGVSADGHATAPEFMGSPAPAIASERLPEARRR
jgi:lipopolysaccharide/colanic/teichoic acid biosynthesis glycosyltransferase